MGERVDWLAPPGGRQEAEGGEICGALADGWHEGAPVVGEGAGGFRWAERLSLAGGGEGEEGAADEVVVRSHGWGGVIPPCCLRRGIYSRRSHEH